MKIADFPAVNAVLNSTSALLLLGGYLLARRAKYRAHAALMISAVVTSAVFLVFYLIYHYHVRETHIGEKFPYLAGWLRGIYFLVLIPHLLLAIVMVPMILLTLWRASRRRWDAHRKIARPTLFIWLYVSVTGVVIYAMLYHLFPALKP